MKTSRNAVSNEVYPDVNVFKVGVMLWVVSACNSTLVVAKQGSCIQSLVPHIASGSR